MGGSYRRPWRRLACAVSAALALAALQGIAGAREGSTLGFLIVDTRLAMHYGPFEADCPGGFEPTVEENFLATLSPDERERILRPENAEEYANAWKGDFINGPGGENVCQNPKAFMDDPRHPPHRGIQSRVAYGLNLDGTPDGRATPLTVGCYKSRRGTGESQQQGSELDPFLIELRGVDDLENDRRVEVGIYSLAADDLVIRTPGGAPLPHQSFRVTSNPKWRNETTGRIVNGELRVDHLDRLFLKFRLFTWGAFGEVYSHEFRRVRFKLKLEEAGGVSGIMGGYRPLWNISTVAYCCRATASTANMDCASEYKTFVQMADGDPDPETGQCTTISAAQRIGGIPAYVIHEEE